MNHFNGEIGNAMFPRITADEFIDDRSMTSTLRALLGSRAGDDFVKAQFSNAAEGWWLGSVETNMLYIHDLPVEEGGVAAKAESFMAKYPGFRIVEDLGVFCQRECKFEAVFLQNEETRVTAVLTRGLDLARWHLIQGFTSRLFPWYFRDKPLSEAERALVTSLTQTQTQKYTRAIEALYANYDFREAIIRTKLDGFEKVTHRNELERTERRLSELRRDLENLNEQFRAIYQEVDQQTTKQRGLFERMEEDGDNEVMEYFLRNPHLHLEEVNGATVTFTVATVINNFDPEVFDAAIRNRRSFWYRSSDGNRYTPDVSDDQIELFARAVFETEELKIKICAAYLLDFGSGQFCGLSNHKFSGEFEDYMPNMHVQRFACLGSGHEMSLRDAMLRGDQIGALDICVASAGNISMEEMPTGQEHMKFLLGPSCGKCVILPDGTEVTAKEAIKWLEEKGGEA